MPATDNSPPALVPHKTSTWHAVYARLTRRLQAWLLSQPVGGISTARCATRPWPSPLVPLPQCWWGSVGVDRPSNCYRMAEVPGRSPWSLAVTSYGLASVPTACLTVWRLRGCRAYAASDLSSGDGSGRCGEDGRRMSLITSNTSCAACAAVTLLSPQHSKISLQLPSTFSNTLVRPSGPFYRCTNTPSLTHLCSTIFFKLILVPF